MIIPLVMIFLISLMIPEKNKENNEFTLLLPQIKERDRLAFLQAYFMNEDPKNIQNYLEINRNTLIVQDLTSGSNAVTLLCLDNENKYYYKKYALFKDGEKLKVQYEWLKNHSDLIKVSKIIRLYEEKDYFGYDMEYIENSMGLFKMVHTCDFNKATSIIGAMFNDLENSLYLMNQRKNTEEEVRKYIEQKVTKNINILQKSNGVIKSVLKYDTLSINNVNYRNLTLLKQYLEPEHLYDIFKNDVYSDVHGDLTIENIIYHDNNYYLIDPNTGNIHESKFLDYAKFLQSIHGNYEFYMKIQYVTVNKEHIDYFDSATSVYADLFGWYKHYLESRFSYEECRSIFYHEVVHWLRLLPYKIAKDNERAAAFYAGFIKVFNNVVEWYEK